MFIYDLGKSIKLGKYISGQKKHYCWLSLAFLLLFSSTAVDGRAEAPEIRVILLNLARADFTDLTATHYPNFQWLLANGGCGLVSTRMEGALTPEKVYLAFSSGRDLFFSSTGLVTDPQGMIGAVLHREGKKTALLGNADLPWEINRKVRLMLADGYGAIDRELTGREFLLADPAFPFRFRTDYRLLAGEIFRLLPEVHLLLVNPGDLERLEGYRRMLSDARFALLRRESLTRIDALVGELVAGLPEGTVLCLLSTGPSSFASADDSFLPLLVYAKTGKSGLLASPSTREKGLLTMGDFTAGLLRYLTGQDQGRESLLTVEPGDWQELAAKRDTWLNNLAQRKIILRIYLGLVLFFTGLSILAPFIGRMHLVTGLQLLLPGLAAFPLALMLVAPFRLRNIVLLSFLLAGGTAVLWLFFRKTGRTTLQAYRWLLTFTAAMILFDLVSGSGLMSASLLGPSQVLGARFYGLGNEYLGIFLGALLVGAAGLFTGDYGRRWGGLWLGACALVLFSPQGGANFGGGLCMSFAALQICRRWPEKKTVKRNLLLFLLVLSAGLFYFFLRPVAGNTHLHGALQLIAGGRWDMLAEIAGRKLKMNWGLINYHPAVKLSLFIFILLYIFQKAAGKTVLFTKNKNEWYWPGISLALDTGILALLVNDSGITVLGTILLYPLLLFCYLLLVKKTPESE